MVSICICYLSCTLTSFVCCSVFLIILAIVENMLFSYILIEFYIIGLLHKYRFNACNVHTEILPLSCWCMCFIQSINIYFYAIDFSTINACITLYKYTLVGTHYNGNASNRKDWLHWIDKILVNRQNRVSG